ncbi:MAG TPA: Uma2 family endonuclease [Pyrinomonadaceae bacterium]|nr:Uma2 family endonuclease [Pyrinomonadaceae bacterium]
MVHTLTELDYPIPPELIALTHQSVTPEQFERLCGEYRELRLELTSTGELIVMPPTGSETGRSNADLTYQLMAWTKKDATGVCFGCSVGFTLPNGAIRSPDGSWIRRERWDSLTEQQKKTFAPICPDFAIELCSASDTLKELNLKMFEYLENGASLGWLIDPFKRQVYIYEPNHEVVVLDNPETVSGDPLLPGFRLYLSTLW